MAIVDYKHVKVSSLENGNAADDLNENFRELANRTGQIVLVSGSSYTAYHPSADTDAARGAALSSAVAAAVSGDALLLGAGTFAHNAAMAVESGVTIRGLGQNTVISRAGEIFTIDVESNIAFSDMSFAGRVTVSGGINVSFDRIHWTSNGQSVRLHCDDASGATDPHDIAVRDCRFTGVGQAIFSEFGSRYIIRSNWFWNATGTAAVEFDQGGATKNSSEVASGHIIQGNHFRNTVGWGLYVYGVHDPIITGNTFEDNTLGGINVIGPIQTLICNNILERNTSTQGTESGTGVGIRIEIISGTTLRNMSAEAPAQISDNHCAFHSKHIEIVGTFNQSADILIGENVLHRSTGGAAVDVSSYRADYNLVIQNNLISSGDDAIEHDGINVSALSAVSADKLIIKGNTISGRVDAIGLADVTGAWLLNNVLDGCTDAIELSDSASANAHFNVFKNNTNDLNDISGTLTQSNNIGFTP